MRFPALQSRNFVIFTAGNFSAMNALWINRVVIGWLGWPAARRTAGQLRERGRDLLIDRRSIQDWRW